MARNNSKRNKNKKEKEDEEPRIPKPYKPPVLMDGFESTEQLDQFLSTKMRFGLELRIHPITKQPILKRRKYA